MLEVADIFRKAGPAYRQRFGAHMRPSQFKAMRDIECCRTPALGGHLHRCDHCTHLQYSYHSCRNRHCPKCQGEHTQRWLDEQQAWRRPVRPDFLIPCRILSVIFRAKVRDALKQAKLADQVPQKAWNKRWVTHCRHAGDGQKALRYVARYIHRIAICNSRLESFDQQQVTFRYCDSHTGQLQRCVLPADQFISRFMEHVLPNRFTKVRYYGLFSPRCRDALERARALLHQSKQPPVATPQQEHSTGKAVPQKSDRACPVCLVGRMRVVADLVPQHRLQVGLRAPPAESA